MRSAKVIHLGTVLALALGPAVAAADETSSQGRGQPSSPQPSSPQPSSPPNMGGQPFGPSGTMGPGGPSAGGLALQGPRPNLSEMRRGRVVRVNDMYTGQTSSNCTYRATVSGNVQEYLPRSSAQGGGPGQLQGMAESVNSAYVPHLRINTQLQCPDRAVQRSTMATLEGTPLTRTELERVVGDLAVVASPMGDRMCLYSSEFAFVNDRLTGRSLAQRCMPMIGGGPASHGEPGYNQGSGRSNPQGGPTGGP